MQTISSNSSQQTVVVVQQPPMITSKSTAEVTLNMLNASENEVDVEGFNFEGANEVVNTWNNSINTNENKKKTCIFSLKVENI